MNPSINIAKRNNSPRRLSIWMWIFAWFVLTGCGLFTSDNIWLNSFDDEPKSVTKLAADRLIFEGIGYFQVENYEKALELFMQVIEIEPDRPTLHYHIGLIYSELGQNERAISYYEKEIELYPSYALAYYSRGLNYIFLNENEKAITDLKQSLLLDPSYEYAYWALGNAYHSLNEINLALENFDKYIELAGDSADAGVIQFADSLRD